ncbi:MAG: AIPR family protein [bacterium]
MNLEDFRTDWVSDLRVAAEANQSDPHSEFVIDAIDQLQEAEEVENVELGYFEGIGPNRTKLMVDGYAFDVVDKSCVLLLSDFSNSGDLQTLTRTDIDRLYNNMRNLLEASLNGYIVANKFEESSIGYTFAVEAKRLFDNGEISKFRFYILTDKKLSETVKNIRKEPINGKSVDLNAWDINRFYHLFTSTQGKEEIEIDASTLLGGGIPYVSATKGEDYSAYLAVVPGQFLADIYLEYGSRLLEGNVRSFLSIRGKVNKAIRGTILQHPDLFFAYNNGIAATATSIETTNINGNHVITKINDMQIINGGQTTASIANAVIQDKASLEDVYIPMKLSVLDHDKAKDMIPNISRSANSQNKVDEADFFSNHPYHVRIEEYSRRILAPPVDGNQYQTAWFYERARGQYVQEQMKLTRSERKRYQLKNPKAQLLRKVDVAKFINSYEQKPHIVSRGAQFNMRNFADSIGKQWSPTDQNTSFNEYYYKKLISLAIIFKTTEKIVTAQQWYQEIKAYRANIVTYSIAVIMHSIEKKYPGKTIDFLRIWNTQSISPQLEAQIVETTREVFDFITRDERPTLNVTQWCKQEDCWKRVQEYNFTILDNFAESLVNASDEQEEKAIAQKEQKVSNQISAEIEIINLGTDYWKKVLDFGRNDRLLSEMEDGLLNVAATFDTTGRVPSDKQAKLIMQIRNRLFDEGLSRNI